MTGSDLHRLFASTTDHGDEYQGGFWANAGDHIYGSSDVGEVDAWLSVARAGASLSLRLSVEEMGEAILLLERMRAAAEASRAAELRRSE